MPEINIAQSTPALTLKWSDSLVSTAMRRDIKPHAAKCVWLTGLSGSGKSTLANELERQLNQAGKHTYLLDGDNVRQGLCRDLGMSVDDRRENIRRVGEVAQLMVDAGLIVIAAFISPSQADRDNLKAGFSKHDFIEVHVDTPIEVCEQRDPKGLYQKARRGEIKEFTGVSATYEKPLNPDLCIDTSSRPVQESVAQIMQYCDFGINQ